MTWTEAPLDWVRQGCEGKPEAPFQIRRRGEDDGDRRTMHAALVAAVCWCGAVSAQLMETGREGDGFCTFGTCTETGAIVSWAHCEGALIRGCPSTPGVGRFLLRLRTTAQDDPTYTENLFIEVEDRARCAVTSRSAA
jgi:hypothetical protein